MKRHTSLLLSFNTCGAEPIFRVQFQWEAKNSGLVVYVGKPKNREKKGKGQVNPASGGSCPRSLRRKLGYSMTST